MAEHELLIGNKGLFSKPSWQKHQERFEQNLGKYAYNNPSSKKAADKGLLKLRNIMLSKSEDKSYDTLRSGFFMAKRDAATDEEKDYFDKLKKSSGQIGYVKDDSDIDQIIPRDDAAVEENSSSGNLREKMTAFFNAAYYGRSDFALKQILMSSKNVGEFKTHGLLSSSSLIELLFKCTFSAKDKTDEEKKSLDEIREYLIKIKEESAASPLKEGSLRNPEDYEDKISELKKHYISLVNEAREEAIRNEKGRIGEIIKIIQDTINGRQDRYQSGIGSIKEYLGDRQGRVNKYNTQSAGNIEKHNIFKFIAAIKNKRLLKKLGLTTDDLNYNFEEAIAALGDSEYRRTSSDSVNNSMKSVGRYLVGIARRVGTYNEQSNKNTEKYKVFKFIAAIKNKRLLKKLGLTTDDLGHDFTDELWAIDNTKSRAASDDPTHIDYPSVAASGLLSVIPTEKLYKDLKDHERTILELSNCPKCEVEAFGENGEDVLNELIGAGKITNEEKLNCQEKLKKLKEQLEESKKRRERTSERNNRLLTHLERFAPDTSLEKKDMFRWGAIAECSSLEDDGTSEKIFGGYTDAAIASRIREISGKIAGQMQALTEKKKRLSDLDQEEQEKLKKKKGDEEELRALEQVGKSSGMRKMISESKYNIASIDKRLKEIREERSKLNKEIQDEDKKFKTARKSLEDEKKRLEDIQRTRKELLEISTKIEAIDQQLAERSADPSFSDEAKQKLLDNKKKSEDRQKRLLRKFTESDKLVTASEFARTSRGSEEKASLGRDANYYESIGAPLSERERSFLGVTDQKELLPWVSGRMDKKVKEESSFFKFLNQEKGMRLLTGISGTAARMLQAYKYLGFENNKDLLDFRLALMGWMLLAEDHSLYEILMGSHIAGVKGKEDLSDASKMDKTVSPLKTNEIREKVCEKYDGEGLFPHEICYLEERVGGGYNSGLQNESSAGELDTASDVGEKVKAIKALNKAKDKAREDTRFNVIENLSIRSYTSQDYLFINHIVQLSARQAKLDIETRVKTAIKYCLTTDVDNIYSKEEDPEQFIAIQFKDKKIKKAVPMFIFSKIKKYAPYVADFDSEDAINKRVDEIYKSHPDINAEYILAIFSSEVQIAAEVLKKMPNKFKGTVYRGFGINKKNIEKYEPGKNIDFRRFTSTSKEKRTAEKFKPETQGDTIGAVYEIKTHGKYGVDIRAVSRFASEDEILMPPGSKIKINEVETKENGDLYIRAEED